MAPPSQRTLDAGPYLLGALELALVVAALVYAAVRLRRAILPGWSGAAARVAETVASLALATWLGELLGTFGGFSEAAMLAGALVVAAGAGPVARAAGPRLAGPAPTPPSEPSSAFAGALALGACAALAAAWMIPTLGTLAAGMDRADTLWYHMPLSARFAETGDVGSIYFFDPIFLASFYPANSELLHAIPLLFFERDIVSPVLNLGWLALALGSCWAIGRPYGVAPVALVGGAVVLGSQSLVEFQAGEALNDINGVALVLAAVALLVNGHAERAGARAAPAAAVVVAGVAAGLAAGTKLSFLAPVGALAVAVVVIAQRAARLRTAGLFALPAIAAGGYWYLRNLVAVGNPIPYISSIGPLDLPAPERDFELRPGFTVAHYLADSGIWSDWFVPGFEESYGALWAVTVFGVLAIGAYGLWRGRDPLLRALAGVALLTGLAYVVTPLTAAGEEGEPIAFVWNLRYLAPAIGVAFALVPCLPALRATPARRAATAAALAVLVAFTIGGLVQWDQGHTKGAAAAAALVLAAGAAAWWLAARGLPRFAAQPLALAAAAVLAGAGALAAGWAEQRHYLTHRYENTGDVQRLDGALRWARDVRDARIAVAGVRGVFTQYAFYGTDLSNHVQWLGREGDDEAYLRIATCEEWRAELAAGGFTHVVTTFDPYLPGDAGNSPEGRWTGSDPAAEVVLSDGPVRVFELHGAPDPGGCGDQPPLPERKLHGVPNLTGPPDRD